MGYFAEGDSRYASAFPLEAGPRAQVAVIAQYNQALKCLKMIAKRPFNMIESAFAAEAVVVTKRE